MPAHGQDHTPADDAHAHSPVDEHGTTSGHVTDPNDSDLHGAGDHHGGPPIAEDLAFWSTLAFIGFLFAMQKLGIFDWLLTSMAAREKEQNYVISVAEGHLNAAHTDLNQYRGKLEAMDETVQEILAEAGRDAEHARTQIVLTAENEARLMVKRAEVEIGRARDHSLHNLFEHFANSVSAAVETRVRQGLEASDQDRLIDDTLNQMAET